MINFSREKFYRASLRSAFFPAFVFFCFSAAYGQPEKYELDDSPPPLKVISENERKQLNASKGVKERTKLALELMQTKLTSATMKSDAGDHAAMFQELGVFHAIMDDTLAYLDRLTQDRNARLNNFKRMEIGLRRMTVQIDLLRRNAPSERERYLLYLSRNVRDARSRAIEPLFSDTVVPGSRQQQYQ